MEDYADRVVIEARAKDWVSRHMFLRLYSRNATMFNNLQKRLGPDEWLWGQTTGVRAGEGAIPLHEYGCGRPSGENPKKQRKLHECFGWN